MPEETKIKAPPRSGRGSGKEAWVDFAGDHDEIEVDEENDSRDDIIDKAIAAGVIPEEDDSDGDDEGDETSEAGDDETPSEAANEGEDEDEDESVPDVPAGTGREETELTNVDDEKGAARVHRGTPPVPPGEATEEEREAAQPEQTPERQAAPATVRGQRAAEGGEDEDVVLEEDLSEDFVPPRSRRTSTRLIARAGQTVKQSTIDAVEENNEKVQAYLEGLPSPTELAEQRAARREGDDE